MERTLRRTRQVAADIRDGRPTLRLVHADAICSSGNFDLVIGRPPR